MVINSALYKSVHSPLAGICFTWLQSVLSFAVCHIVLSYLTASFSLNPILIQGSRLILAPRRRSTNRAASTNPHSDDGVSIPLSPISPRSPGPFSPRFSDITMKVPQQSIINKSATSSPISELPKVHEWDKLSSSDVARAVTPMRIQVEVMQESDRFSYGTSI